MNSFLFLPHYFAWHYGRGLRDFKKNWFSLVSFTYRFFSIPTLFRTLFVPWRRLTEEVRHTDGETFLMSVVTNLLMRIVGFVIRTFVIFLGLLAFLFVALGGGIVFLGWILFPVVFVFLVAIIVRLFLS